MQLIGWIDFGIRPDSVQSILLLIVRGYTSRCILQSVVFILHNLLTSLHNTFLALRCQKSSPSNVMYKLRCDMKQKQKDINFHETFLISSHTIYRIHQNIKSVFITGMR